MSDEDKEKRKRAQAEKRKKLTNPLFFVSAHRRANPIIFCSPIRSANSIVSPTRSSLCPRTGEQVNSLQHAPSAHSKYNTCALALVLTFSCPWALILTLSPALTLTLRPALALALILDLL